MPSPPATTWAEVSRKPSGAVTTADPDPALAHAQVGDEGQDPLGDGRDDLGVGVERLVLADLESRTAVTATPVPRTAPS